MSLSNIPLRTGHEPASFTLFRRGGTFYAKDDRTGNLRYKDADAAIVIQWAVNALLNGGKIVLKATAKEAWAITRQIVVQSPVHLLGSGDLTLSFIATTIPPPGTEAIWEFKTGSAGSVIEKLIFDGNAGVAPSIRNMTIGGKYSSILDCTFKRTPYIAVEIQADDCKIIENTFIECGSVTPGAILHLGTAKRAIVSKNCFYENYYTSIDTSYRPETDGAIIEGNVCYTTKAFTLAHGEGISVRSHFVTVANNYISGFHNGIVADSKNVITGNVLENIAHVGIYSDGISTPSGETRGTIIAGNFIYCNPGSTDGILLNDYSYECSIIGNTIYGSEYGIRVWNGTATGFPSQYNTIVGNTILSTVSHGIFVAAQGFANKSDYNIVESNVVKSCGGYGIYVDTGVAGTVVLGNIVKDNVLGQIYDGGTGTVKKSNVGYATENRGTASVTGAVNSVAVNHLLAGTPTVVNVTPAQGGQGDWWVTGKGAAQFTINFVTQPGASTWYFDWSAEV